MNRGALWCLAVILQLALCAGRAHAAQGWDNDDFAALLQVAELTPEEGIPIDELTIAELRRLIDDQNLETEDRDERASEAYRRIARRFAFGQTDPRLVDPDWHILPQLFSFEPLLDFAVSQDRIEDTLTALLPHGLGYLALKAELARVEGEQLGFRDATGLSREERAAKLRVNMERWRWLPRVFPATRIEVYVPEYRLVFVDQDRVAERNDVIVGEVDRPTPVFEASIHGVIINPSWFPPPSLIFGKLLPRFREDSSVPGREGFEVKSLSGELLDPSTIDWHAIKAPPFPYLLRQLPGTHNALGQVKFDMPNPYSILLHDTPSKGLFERERRAFSAGCIRVKNALGLAEALVARSEPWSEEKTEAALANEEPTRIGLAAPIPVFVLYLTATALADGSIRYIDDIYGRDGSVAHVLENLPRMAQAASAAQFAAMAGCHA